MDPTTWADYSDAMWRLLANPQRIIWTIGAVLMGGCVGSFVNVLIYRLPRERSVVTPPSHCFCCGTELGVLDLIPVVSYLRCRGMCRYCGVALSPQYAIVEAIVAVLFGVIAWRWGFALAGWGLMGITACLVAAFVIDLRYRIIPSPINTAIFFLGLGTSIAVWAVRLLGERAGLDGWEVITGQGWLWVPSPVYSLAGAALAYVVFEAIVRIGRVIFRQEAMGGGDVLLAGALGTLLGPGRFFGTFFLVAIMTGALVGLGLILSGRLSRRDPMPFGPYLVIGALTVFLAPEVADVIAGHYGFGSLGG